MEEEYINILENVLKTKEYGLCEITDTFYKAIENLLKRHKELKEENNIITTGRRNGKTIELAMKLREEILKLPECRLYGIKNCKNKIVLLTKEECIPISVIQNKIDELEEKRKHISEGSLDYQLRQYNYIGCKIDVLQELLDLKE